MYTYIPIHLSSQSKTIVLILTRTANTTMIPIIDNSCKRKNVDISIKVKEHGMYTSRIHIFWNFKWNKFKYVWNGVIEKSVNI